MLPKLNSNQKGLSQILVITIVLLVLAVGGYLIFTKVLQTNNSAKDITRQDEILTVKTTLVKASPSEPQMLIIKKYGLDKKNGLNLEYVDSNPGDAEREFFEGKFNIILSGTLSSFTAHLKQIPILIAAPAINQPFHIIVPTDSPIKTLADLKGKKFGTLPKISASYMSTATILRSAGIDPEKDLQIVFATTVPILDLIEKGEVDAGIAVKPNAYSLIASGKYRSIADLEQVWEEKEDGLPMPFVVVAVRGDWYNSDETNKEITRRFIKTFNDASAMIQKDPKILEELTDYLVAYKLDSPTAIDLLKTDYPLILHNALTQKGMDGLRRMYERGKEYKVIPENVPSFEEVVLDSQELGL